MADFQFIQNPLSHQWVILAPRRAKRPDVAEHVIPICPFCIGQEKLNTEVCRVGGKAYDENWRVRVINNKYPFAPVHEVIVHSPDHHKNFDELPFEQVRTIVSIYRDRYRAHEKSGQVYIFNNRGEMGGESLPHPHTQLVVVPYDIPLSIPPFYRSDEDVHETKRFILFCPIYSQWPDEVWIVPKLNNRVFGEITDEELDEFAYVLQRLIQLLDLRHGHNFPFNFYIYPAKNWYLRVIPKYKTLGGFEVGTQVFVNTQDPIETIAFIKHHFENPDEETIRKHHKAVYLRSV